MAATRVRRRLPALGILAGAAALGALVFTAGVLRPSATVDLRLFPRLLPEDYEGFKPPAVGSSYVDSRFGARIMRLTDGGAFHDYATMTAVNADDTLVLAESSRGYWVIDVGGRVVVPVEALNIGPYESAKWSRTDPGLVYYYRGNALMVVDVRSREHRVVRRFTEFKGVSDGGGSTDVSEDGDHLIIDADDRYIGVYQISTDRLGPLLDTMGFDREEDAVDISPDNRVVINWHASPRHPRKTVEVYDNAMRFQQRLETTGGHWDLGRDVNGDEILLTFAWSDSSDPPGCEQGGLIKTRLRDGVEVCVSGGWNGQHVSAVGPSPWVVVSSMDHEAQTADPILPVDWRTRWRPFENEIVVVKTDGSVVRRLAHHRSRRYQNYYYYPFATTSASGRTIVFNSNMGMQPFPDYTDIYAIRLGKDAMPADVQPPPK